MLGHYYTTLGYTSVNRVLKTGKRPHGTNSKTWKIWRLRGFVRNECAKCSIDCFDLACLRAHTMYWRRSACFYLWELVLSSDATHPATIKTNTWELSLPVRHTRRLSLVLTQTTRKNAYIQQRRRENRHQISSSSLSTQIFRKRITSNQREYHK